MIHKNIEKREFVFYSWILWVTLMKSHVNVCGSTNKLGWFVLTSDIASSLSIFDYFEFITGSASKICHHNFDPSLRGRLPTLVARWPVKKFRTWWWSKLHRGGRSHAVSSSVLRLTSREACPLPSIYPIQFCLTFDVII